MNEDDGRGILHERGLEDLPGIDVRHVDGPFGHLLHMHDLSRRVQAQQDEKFLFLVPEDHAYIIQYIFRRSQGFTPRAIGRLHVLIHACLCKLYERRCILADAGHGFQLVRIFIKDVVERTEALDKVLCQGFGVALRYGVCQEHLQEFVVVKPLSPC